MVRGVTRFSLWPDLDSNKQHSMILEIGVPDSKLRESSSATSGGRNKF